MYQAMARKSGISAGFWLLSILLPFLAFPFLYCLGQLVLAAPVGNFSRALIGVCGTLLFGWLFASAGGYWLQYRRLLGLRGAVLTVSRDGFVDHWRLPKRTLDWNEVERAEWINTAMGPMLRFQLFERRRFEERFLSFGFPRLHYPARLLESDMKTISDAICALAPRRIWE